MKAFDEIASEWNELRRKPMRCLELFLPELKKTDTVLDAGCGNGRNLVEIAKVAREAYGTDSSSEMLRFARERLLENQAKNACVVDGNIMRLPFQKGFFDKIFCSAVLHHLNSREQPIAVEEFSRVLKEGGLVFATVWSEKRFRERKEGHVKWGKVQRYHYFFTPKEFGELFERLGFRVAGSFYEKAGKKVGREDGQNLVVIAQR